MKLTRVAQSRTAVLTHVFEVGETPTDPTGTPTYTIVDANGASVATGNATVVGSGSGEVTATLAGQPQTKFLKVTWTGTIAGISVTEVDYCEVASGFFFTLAEARASDASLANTTNYPTAELEAKRLEVEMECEQICQRAFLPRYRRLVLDGNGTNDLILPINDVRTIRRASMADRADETFTDLTAGQLAALVVTDDGLLRRVDLDAWTLGDQNIVLELEYGLDQPPADLVAAAKTRLRSRLNLNKTGVPDRAMSFTIADGGTYRLSMPDAWQTGIPDVDAVYRRYSLRDTSSPTAANAVPASRTMAYEPQRNSLFHWRTPPL